MIKVDVVSTAIPTLVVTFDCEPWLVTATNEEILKLADEEVAGDEELLELVTWARTKPGNSDLQHLCNAEEELSKLSRYKFYSTGLEIDVDYHALHEWLRHNRREIWHKLNGGTNEQ